MRSGARRASQGGSGPKRAARKSIIRRAKIFPPRCGHAATLAGAGIGLAPTFVVGKDLAEGRLVSLMPDYQPGCKPAAAIPLRDGRG
jgi:DNA-binding transcriptional LysR family regulator